MRSGERDGTPALSKVGGVAAPRSRSAYVVDTTMKRSLILGREIVDEAGTTASGRRSLSRVSRSSLDSGRKLEKADSG